MSTEADDGHYRWTTATRIHDEHKNGSTTEVTEETSNYCHGKGSVPSEEPSPPTWKMPW
jgi:hypothetical protein